MHAVFSLFFSFLVESVSSLSSQVCPRFCQKLLLHYKEEEEFKSKHTHYIYIIERATSRSDSFSSFFLSLSIREHLSIRETKEKVFVFLRLISIFPPPPLKERVLYKFPPSS